MASDVDPLVLRAIERFMIVGGAIIFGFFGFGLFSRGIEKGHNKLAAESRWFKIVFSGTGPGLFFMAFGAIILVTALCMPMTTTERHSESHETSMPASSPSSLPVNTTNPGSSNQQTLMTTTSEATRKFPLPTAFESTSAFAAVFVSVYILKSKFLRRRTHATEGSKLPTTLDRILPKGQRLERP